MSHNVQKIQSIEPDRNSSTSLVLHNLSNVNVPSPSNNQILKYVGSAWVAANPVSAVFNSGGYAAGWSGSTRSSGSAYSTSGALDSYRTHSATNWGETAADQSRIQNGGVTITRGTHGGSVPTQVRFSKITVDVGKYLLFATTRSLMTTSGNYIEWQWLDTDTDAALGPRWRSYASAADDVSYGIGYIEVTTGTRTCDVRVIARTGGNDAARQYGDILAALQIG